MVEFGLVWMSSVWCGLVHFDMDEFGFVWMSLSFVQCGLFLMT